MHLPLHDITFSLLKLCYLNVRSLHKHIEDIRKDLIYLSADINIFTETRFNSQDNNDMYDIAGYVLFRNDNLNSSNGSRSYGGTAVYSKIPYLPGSVKSHTYLDTPIVTIYMVLK